MEVKQIRSTAGVTEAQGMTASSGVQTPKPRPLLGGDLTVKMAPRNVLDELNRMESVEEPSREDSLSRTIRDLLASEAPEMPQFI